MKRSQEIVSKLTLKEKASLLSGLYNWTNKPIKRDDVDIPAVLMTDGPHGLRKEKGSDSGEKVNIMGESLPATCFPPAVTLASSWDVKLVSEVAKAIGEEAIDQDISTVLGPGTNIKRSPLCGRNFEYFSEDPYLAGQLATNYILGMKTTGVGSSLKHYCANNEEYCRMSISSVIDERTLREIYLPAFETAVKNAQPQQIMCSYNLLNGVFMSENKRMLTDVLRDEWGFEGMVVSDWGAVNDRVSGVKAGLDLQMPGSGGIHDYLIVKAVEDGTLSEEDVDKCVIRVLNYVYDCIDKKPKTKPVCDYDRHHEIAVKAGESGSVLLKNDDDILPLKPSDKIALIGKMAEESRYQGSGSSRINTRKLVNVLDVFRSSEVSFEYAQGYTVKDEGRDDKAKAEAIKVAEGKDKVVIVMGLTDVFESEGFDRTHMGIPKGQVELLQEILKVNKNVVVVLEGGSPIEMPWAKDVKAILNTYLLGEGVGEATFNLLYGKANPSGKLAETYPLSLDDVLAQKYFPMGPKTTEYRESIYVGYRQFDAQNKPVAYPFGFGLSYTKFEYSDLKVDAEYKEGDTLSVKFTVKNVGKVKGAEVAQLYVGQTDSPVYKAVKELKGFAKVELEPDESKEIELKLDSRSFAFYNVAIKDWHVLSGNYVISVGGSSRDIYLTADVKVQAQNDALPLPDRQGLDVYYDVKNVTEIPQEAFATLYGSELPDNTPAKRGEFHVNTTLGELSVTGLGKFVLKVVSLASKIIAKDAANRTMIVNSARVMPLRCINSFTGGMFSFRTVEGLVDVFNKKKGGWGKFFGGFKLKYRHPDKYEEKHPKKK